MTLINKHYESNYPGQNLIGYRNIMINIRLKILGVGGRNVKIKKIGEGFIIAAMKYLVW